MSSRSSVRAPGTTRAAGVRPSTRAARAPISSPSNRNKLSVAADLDDAADRALLGTAGRGARTWWSRTSVAGTLERRGLGPAEMLARHPRLVWCTITGFGLESPRPGYDFVVQAESGWMAITGDARRRPDEGRRRASSTCSRGRTRRSRSSPLLAGDRRGERRLSVSLVHSATAALVNIAQNALVTGEESPPLGERASDARPLRPLRDRGSARS